MAWRVGTALHALECHSCGPEEGRPSTGDGDTGMGSLSLSHDLADAPGDSWRKVASMV